MACEYMFPAAKYKMKTTLTVYCTKNRINHADKENAKKLLSSSEQARYNNTQHPRKSAEYLQSRYALRIILSQRFNRPIQYWNIQEQHNDKPYITNLPDPTHFSISHSKDLIVISIADFRHGIDIENSSQERDFRGLAEHAFDKEEQALMQNNINGIKDGFYSIWCAKEAWFKAIPKQQQPTSINSLPYSSLMNQLTTWYLQTWSLLPSDMNQLQSGSKIIRSNDYNSDLPELDRTYLEKVKTHCAAIVSPKLVDRIIIKYF